MGLCELHASENAESLAQKHQRQEAMSLDSGETKAADSYTGETAEIVTVQTEEGQDVEIKILEPMTYDLEQPKKAA